MVTMKHMRKAIKLFKNDLTDKSVQRANQRKWLSAVAKMGDQWILARPVPLVKRTGVVY